MAELLVFEDGGGIQALVRTWAARYDAGDVWHDHWGSKDSGIEKQSYASVVATNLNENLLMVENKTAKL